jgi:hypothetical protein
MRADFNSPTQLHAANIIDSIVLDTLGDRGRDGARDLASQDWASLGMQVVAEGLALRPLFRALTTWYLNRGTPPPDHFARHATVHAVGQPDLFHPRYMPSLP